MSKKKVIPKYRQCSFCEEERIAFIEGMEEVYVCSTHLKFYDAVGALYLYIPKKI